MRVIGVAIRVDAHARSDELTAPFYRRWAGPPDRGTLVLQFRGSLSNTRILDHQGEHVKTDVLTPVKVFKLSQRLVVPLFQRKYVWDEEGQWELLWDDIQRLADLLCGDPNSTAQHFLGAVVLQEQDAAFGDLASFSVIDGQQRLTTLQLLLDAAGAAFEDLGEFKLARVMDKLTHNDEDDISDPRDVLKVWPTNRDRDAFVEVMQAPPPVAYDELLHPHSLLVKGHEYFARRVATWLEVEGPDARSNRAVTLAKVLQVGLQMVVITVDRQENSQEIFETLNARGTPLTAADLIKNFVFQRLALPEREAEAAYHQHWEPFEDAFWEKRIGRQAIARSSLFLQQWLVAQTGEEVSPRIVFARFKHFVDRQLTLPLADLLPTLRAQADLYRRWIERADDSTAELSQVELFVYRTQATDYEFVKPLLLWLWDLRQPRTAATQMAVIDIVESWAMRRALVGLSTGGVGQFVATLIAEHRDLPDDELPGRLSAYLARINGNFYWPGDDEIRRDLKDRRAYRFYSRTRLRMFLEAAEDHERGFTSGKLSKTGSRVPRNKFNIEHLMPQRWTSSWPLDSDDLAAQLDRDAHVHRLGNLTLITASLNSAVSNGPWSGSTGKRAQLDRHDVLLMNRWIRHHGAEQWGETLIDERTDLLVEQLLSTWKVPEGHVGRFEQRADSELFIEVRDLVANGLLNPGTVLTAREGRWGDKQAVVLPNGQLQVDGHEFGSPSGAAGFVRGGPTDGWRFWRLPNGQQIREVREDYRRSVTGGAEIGSLIESTDAHGNAMPATEARSNGQAHRRALVESARPEVFELASRLERLAAEHGLGWSEAPNGWLLRTSGGGKVASLLLRDNYIYLPLSDVSTSFADELDALAEGLAAISSRPIRPKQPRIYASEALEHWAEFAQVLLEFNDVHERYLAG